MTITQAMVLAAGLGTRLRPITDRIPKPLVAVGGRAMIDRVLDLLVAAGIRKAVVNVHHLADQMEAHLAQEDRLTILISDERAGLLNSGGGLAQGLKLLDRSDLIVMNADLFWVGEPEGEPSNLARLAAAFDAGRMDMLLLCVRAVQTTGHDGKLDFSRDGDGRLTRYQPGAGDPVIYAGALAMNPSLLDDAPEGAFNLNICFDRAIASGRLFGLMLEGHWITVGSPDALAPAEAVVARHQSAG